MVGIVLVSHSRDLARGLAHLAAQVAGPDVRIEAAGGGPDGALGTSSDLVNAAIDRADAGDGVVALGDLGSAMLTLRDVLEERGGPERLRLADAPLVEGAVAAAVVAAPGGSLDEVALAAEQARGVCKL